jgi:ethanolamine phosphate phosphodiesterase
MSDQLVPSEHWCRLPDRHKLFIHSLRLCWIAVTLWLELGPFNRVLSSCHWPAAHPQTKDDVRMYPTSFLDSRSPPVQSEPHPRITNILLIADPQILDSHSYSDRGPLLSRLTQFIVDFNLRKSWRLVALKLRPHVVVFLGDMMDGGRGDMGDVE